MKKIWKFEIPLGVNVVHEIPLGGVVVHTGTQNDTIFIWVEVDPSGYRIPRSFKAFGTGHAIQEPFTSYVGTVQQGPFVWHVYEAE